MSSIGDEHNSGPQRADAALVKLVDVLDSRTMHGDKGITGSTTGIDDLDEMSCGLQDSDLIIIAGRPSMGKSTLAENVLTENAYLGKTTLMFTIEMPSEKILERTFCSRKSVPLTITRQADFSELQWTLFTDFVKEITDDDMKMFFDDTPEIGLPEIRARARKIKRTHGLDMIVIDYLQMMKLPKAENRSLAVGEVTRGLKLLAKELNIPIILLSQLNRSLEQRQDKRPIMADLRESGSIEQDADLIIFIYRDEVYYPDTEHKGIAEIIIAKQRMGPKGTVFAKFEGDYCRFKNRSDNYWGDD
jgi:replicative DNA helicase